MILVGLVYHDENWVEAAFCAEYLELAGGQLIWRSAVGDGLRLPVLIFREMSGAYPETLGEVAAVVVV